MRNIIENKKKENPFQLFSLKNDENHRIGAIEVGKIDYNEIINRLEKEEPVYITCKREQKQNIKFIIHEQILETLYFLRS